MTTPTIPEAIAELKRRGACSDARAWLATQPDVVTAWAACARPDWMIWIAVRRGVDRKTIVRIACSCARTALRYVPAGEDRPRLAIETAEAWTEDHATIQEVRAAADAAYAAYAAAAAYAARAAAAYAARAAADAAAADTARAAAAYAAAADAAYAAAAAAAAAAASAAARAARADAAYAAYAAARAEANRQMCAIVRRHITLADLLPEVA